MKSAVGGMSSARKGCMESTRSVVCYQADEPYTPRRDAIRDSVAITYNARGALITYQASFVGLDKKFRKQKLSEFFGGATRNRTGDEGFADLCLTAWLWRNCLIYQGFCAFPFAFQRFGNQFGNRFYCIFTPL